MKLYPIQYCYTVKETEEKKQELEDGTFLKKMPIITLGIQTTPGVGIKINGSEDIITIGPTGIFELDLKESNVKIYTIQFVNLDSIVESWNYLSTGTTYKSPFGLLIDTICEGVEN